MPKFDSLSVKIQTGDTTERGVLRINKDGMYAILGSGTVISENESLYTVYEMTNKILPSLNSDWEETPLNKPVKVSLTPKFTTYRTYVPQGGQYIEDIFPLSSFGFYGRLRKGHGRFLYIVQEIESDTRFWLTVANSDTGQIYEAHTIFPYEAEALSLIDSQEFQKEWYEKIWATVPALEKKKILEILDSKSVKWEELEESLGDIGNRPKKHGNTMREMLAPLISESFPESIREQLMLFLALIVKKEVQFTDPINYLYKFWQFPIVGSLIKGHLMCLSDNVDFPQYLTLLKLASTGNLVGVTRAIQKSVTESPWLLFWQKTMEQFPNWFDIATEIVQELNERGEIISKVPITESAARKSQSAWKKRLALLMYELRILGRVKPRAMGFHKLVYLGVAYRWPHRHMEFITRLGWAGEHTPHLHVMVIPSKEAAERIKRALPNVIDADITVRTSNITLFDKEKKKWNIPTDDILKSVERKYSVGRLLKRYSVDTKIRNYRINREEAKALDLASEGIRVAVLERKEYLAPWGFTSSKIKKVLTKLSENDIIQLFYEVSDQNLVSLATIIDGPSDKVTSISDAFLEATPTNLMMINKKGEQSVLLTRLPEMDAYTLASSLPEMAMEHGVEIRCLRPTTFQSYTHSLYQRLLKEDGTWDDDVSAFLSQARSKRKELSESNA